MAKCVEYHEICFKPTKLCLCNQEEDIQIFGQRPCMQLATPPMLILQRLLNFFYKGNIVIGLSISLLKINYTITMDHCIQQQILTLMDVIYMESTARIKSDTNM
jgi:hypothetical protein